MSWRWTARRLFVSAFLIVHLSALGVWVMPPCPLRQRCIATVSYYMMPLGLWQYWGMFAPDPLGDTLLMEAEVLDAQGLRHRFVFPHLADFSTWGRVPRTRHAKLAATLADEEFKPARAFVARHAVRRLDLPAEAFPVAVRLFHQVRPAAPPGALADPMTPTHPYILGTFQFANRAEVWP